VSRLRPDPTARAAGLIDHEVIDRLALIKLDHGATLSLTPGSLTQVATLRRKPRRQAAPHWTSILKITDEFLFDRIYGLCYLSFVSFGNRESRDDGGRKARLAGNGGSGFRQSRQSRPSCSASERARVHGLNWRAET
jgi:hypothetical protein